MNTLSHQPHSLARTNTVSRQKKTVVEQWDDEFDFLPSDTVLKIPDEINASTLKVNKDLNLIRQFSDFSKDIQKVILSIPDKYVTERILGCKPIPEAVYIITLSDANKSGPFFTSKLSKLCALHPPAKSSPFYTEFLHNPHNKLKNLHHNNSSSHLFASTDFVDDIESLTIDSLSDSDCNSQPDRDYTALPSTLDLDKLVSSSSRIKRELRELLFLLDNTPNFFDESLSPVELTRSIQRHRNSGSFVPSGTSTGGNVSDDDEDAIFAELNRIPSIGSNHSNSAESGYTMDRRDSGPHNHLHSLSHLTHSHLHHSPSFRTHQLQRDFQASMSNLDRRRSNRRRSLQNEPLMSPTAAATT